MKKSGRKFLVIFLAVALISATLYPVQGVAAENADIRQEHAATTEAAGQEMRTALVNDVSQDDGAEPPKEDQVTEDDGNVTPDDGEKDPDPWFDIIWHDTTDPVIESFEFEENGQVLTVDDTLHFTLSAYDADSGIDSTYIYIRGNGNSSVQSVGLEKEEDGNLYTGTFPCSNLKGNYGNQFHISNVVVEDRANNYDNWKTQDEETGKYLYTFTLDYEPNVSVSNFRMETYSSREDGKLAIGDMVTYSADVKCDSDKISYVYSSLYGGYSGRFSEYENLNVSFDEDTGILTGTFTVTEETYPTEWVWDRVSISTDSGEYYSLDPQELEPEAKLSFEVYQEDFDTEPPVIEDITIDKNGQFVEPGDVVKLTVKVKEDHPSRYGYAYIYPQAKCVSDSTYVSLEYDAESSAYVGEVLITEDDYPCEWALTTLYVYDESRNCADLYDFQENFGATLPWYYKVYTKGTYMEETKDVTFKFYGYAKQEDGSYQPDSVIMSQTVKEVGRRLTVAELKEKFGLTFPQPIKGVSAEWKHAYPWWEDEMNGPSIDENTEMCFFGTGERTCYMTAVYDKGCANVSLTYMSKDGEIKTAMIPRFVERGTTYQEVLDALTLPEDADTEEFAGLIKLSYGGDEETQVGDCSYIYAEAQYKDCQVSWNARYIGKDGRETTKTMRKSYLKGTKMSDALAELDAPEEVSGLEFEAWTLTTSAAEEITDTMTSLEVVAVYRGKTTIDASYSFRGENGEVSSDDGMVLMDGEELTDAEIQGGATDAFKDVEHLAGLKLSEWTSIIGVNQPRYKTVSFHAVYKNCVLIFQYPDGEKQYVVLDKGAEYTLPTEHGEYIEIVWEGYQKGECVTVAGDMEFVVQDSKVKDEEQEKPGGAELTEDEIASIKEKIEKAKEGEKIVVDMKKATVVPKEVLEAIKGKPVEISLEMEGYRWTIGGTEVLATNLQDIDLEVKIGTDAIPPSVVSSLAGEKPVTQISLTHNGHFGFRADLTLNLGSENSGGTGSLYYYDSDGKLIYMNSGKIGADGSTSLSFSHASDYVIVIDKAEMPDDDKEDDKNEGSGDNTGDDEDDKNEEPGDNIGGEGDDKNEGPGDDAGDDEDDKNEEPGDNVGGEGDDKNEGPEDDAEDDQDDGTDDNEEDDGPGDDGDDGQEEEDDGPVKDRPKKKGTSVIAVIKKRPYTPTSSSNKTVINTAASSYRKSPKTGE